MNLKLITGGAGTGKSYTLRQLIDAESRPHIIVAPTGMAAVNVERGATTIHKAFCVDLHGHVSSSIYRQPVRRAEVVYIDEVSMVSAQLMNSIQEAFDMLGIDPEVVAFGDLAQLQPVKAEYFFKAEVPDTIERLTVNYRQGNDKEFAEILNRIRVGQVKRSDVDWINDHLEDGSDCLDDYVTLAFSNATVEYINAKRLKDLPGEPLTFLGQMSGNFQEKECRAPLELQLKPGAKIIMLNNDSTGRWQNGTTGIIKSLERKPNGSKVVDIIDGVDQYEDLDTIQVEIKNKTYTIQKHTWLKEEPTKLTDTRREMYEKQLEDPLYKNDPRFDRRKVERILRTNTDYLIVGAYTQYPMKLGYASTVHKAQGQTLENVHIIPDGFGSQHGLTYVALSRLTSVAGLSMPRYLSIMDFKFDRAVAPYL